ncbi:fusarium Solani cutinase mutant with Thr 38 replaced By Phe [Sodiomyces alkalinus F11]|uniref:Cutinase n=1 Tax=Sodiomyces alkalinus (strain CBS 110278 / VKM F-3762 / F11) TaxID=1314773 RepID=A0A3N2QAH6_SODAK|nr:fusarium Solani cutinase mutant with Thr 38 replaced By Phe [Sodiomyces alkalinus F11]ROT43763.1 fusarium Solani cutinase mutant with Thr 38 replaced By Phe [Sodiomyces alkalinus F11]
MKFFSAVTLLAGLAAALPTAVDVAEDSSLETRQLFGSTSRDLENGNSRNCPPIIFIFARGSTESGNLGTLGGPVGDGLQSTFGRSNVWVQGVGGRYSASLGDNALPRGTSRAAITEMVGLFNMANSKCPNAKIVSGGYSQGAALTAAAIEDVSSAIRNNIVGVVLFGYTKNLQNRGGIPSYPSSNLKVYCNTGDLVCTGSLVVTAAHLTYGSDARRDAPRFLAARINAS